MAMINFQEQFVEAIKSGKKRQTIRKGRKYPIRAGETLYLYTGLRTKKAQKLRVVTCIRTHKVTIPIHRMSITIAGRDLTYIQNLNDFAKSDGFEDWSHMTQWFKERYGLPFIGTLIMW